MTGKKIDIETRTLGKAFGVFLLLLALSFVLGIYLGKKSAPVPSAQQEETADRSEQLNACSYKLQELTAKYTALNALANERGLVDQNGSAIDGIVCAVAVKKEEPAPAVVVPEEKKEPEKETVAEKAVPAPGKKTAQDAGAPEPAVKEKDKEKTKKTKEPTVSEEPHNKGTCPYTLQIYAGRSKEEALAAQKRTKVKPTRMVEGEAKGTTWYRLRYGCFETRDQAEKGMAELKEKGERPIIVSEK